jgi:hypothetical protein
MNSNSVSSHPSRLNLRRTILFTSIASLLSVSRAVAADAVLSSGGFTGDADSGVSAAKTYVALANVIGGNVTVNGATFIGSGGGLSGAGWVLNGAGNTFGGGGIQQPLGGAAIAGLFDAFQYNGNPATLTMNGLTAGQTYVVTLYNQAWGLGADRTQTITTTEGASLVYNEDALPASALRYTFVATGTATDLKFLPKIPGNTMHFYGLSSEQVFNNTWTAGSGAWNTPGSWSSGTVPNSVGSNATFAAQAGPNTVTLSGATTTGHIEFQGTGSYTVAGIDPLTLQTDAGGVSVIKADAGGSHTINAPIILGSDLVKFGAGTITTAAGIQGAKSVSVQGGTLKFGATNGYTGGTSVGGGATLDLNGTSQSLGSLNGAGTLANSAG